MATMQSVGKYQLVRELGKGATGKVYLADDPFAKRKGDIKPGNILHKDGTEIKIADFGAAINKVADHTVITNVGSPAYMAPELVTGAAQGSHLTDIYALGVVMYFLLAGRLPFTAANTMS